MRAQFGGAVDPVSAGIQAAVSIASVTSQMVDRDKRRNYEFALSRLSADQQKALNRKLAAAQSQTDRLAILTSAIAQINAQTASEKIRAQSRREMTTAILIVGGGVALILTAFLIKKS